MQHKLNNHRNKKQGNILKLKCNVKAKITAYYKPKEDTTSDPAPTNN